MPVEHLFQLLYSCSRVILIGWNCRLHVHTVAGDFVAVSKLSFQVRNCTLSRGVEILYRIRESLVITTRLLSEYSNAVASTDVIYDAAEEVWQTLPSSTIAAGFPLAYRIARRVVEEEGCNDFLRGSKFHYGVRQDFVDTNTGIRPKKK